MALLGRSSPPAGGGIGAAFRPAKLDSRGGRVYAGSSQLHAAHVGGVLALRRRALEAGTGDGGAEAGVIATLLYARRQSRFEPPQHWRRAVALHQIRHLPRGGGIGAARAGGVFRLAQIALRGIRSEERPVGKE